MKTFDVISDIHLDFWVKIDSNNEKMKKRIKEFTCLILPEKPSDILVIAGDLGHYNRQNMFFLQELKKVYTHIVLVFGNHDLYLISGMMKKKYKNKSMNRLNEMIELSKEMDGIYYLNGESILIDDIIFGGTGLWYDFSYGENELDTSINESINYWYQVSNDAKMIKGIIQKDFFKKEKENLENILEKSDVIITHIPPDFSRFKEKHKKDLAASFYCFDGADLIEKANGKVWCFGHTHHKMDYIKNEVHFVNNALGYPENNLPDKIITITKK